MEGTDNNMAECEANFNQSVIRSPKAPPQGWTVCGFQYDVNPYSDLQSASFDLILFFKWLLCPESDDIRDCHWQQSLNWFTLQRSLFVPYAMTIYLACRQLLFLSLFPKVENFHEFYEHILKVLNTSQVQHSTSTNRVTMIIESLCPK